MLQALGVRLLDADGRDIGPGGAELARLDRIDVAGLDPRVREAEFRIACDVDNPLVGPRGASAVFGPQKGATPAMVAQLDEALAHYADVIRRQVGTMRDEDIAQRPGAGAGGGIAAAMVVFLNGELKPGVEIVTEAIGLDAAVRDADLVVTGEGRIDGQTVHGKTPMGVAHVARRHGKPVVAIGGSLAVDADAVHAHGIEVVVAAVARPCSVAEALAAGADNLRRAARNLAAALALGGRLQQ
jgi:glycerate kinase